VTEAEREVLDQVAAVARSLPRPTLATVCEALERLQLNPGPNVVARTLRPVVHPAARSVGRRLIETWLRKAPHLEPRLIAWALRAACTADEYRLQEQTVELVWTGPVSAPSALRRTQQALLELIQSTRHSLLIVTFAAYKIPEVAAALVQAAERGVAVTLVLEALEDDPEEIPERAIRALGETLAPLCRIYIWPLEHRPRDGKGRHGSLHVKCAVADHSVAFISSANLTGHALSLNMELGVLIRGGDVPARIAEHVNRLIGSNVLVSIDVGG
jgi:phosphatidylserine/phosphatidylglycerophosphate/cardiolipin synthase-like enzyme